jgi:phage protein D
MPNERVIPSSQPKSAATFTILSDGTEVSRTYSVLSIVINKEVNRIPSASIIFRDGEPSKETFEVSNKEDFKPGKEIEIKAGYRSDEVTLFKGIVIRNSIKVKTKNSLFIVECKDKAVKMSVNPKSHYFKDVKDSEIMEELIDKYGLEKEIEATTLTHKEVVQYNSTDWDFMLCRTDMNGFMRCK